jgi:hypothetical protein
MTALSTEDRSILIIPRLLGTFSLWLGASMLPFYVLGFATNGSRGASAGLESSPNALWMLPAIGLVLAALGLLLSSRRAQRSPVTLLLALVLNLAVLALSVWPS